MRRAHNAKKFGNWECFKEACRKEGKLCEWIIERLLEAFDKVAMEDIGRLSIAQDMSRKSTDFLRRINAPVHGMGGVTLSYVCPHFSCFLLMTTHGGYRRDTETATVGRRNIATGGAQRAEATTNGELPTGFLVVQIGANADRAKVFKADVPPWGFV